MFAGVEVGRVRRKKQRVTACRLHQPFASLGIGETARCPARSHCLVAHHSRRETGFQRNPHAGSPARICRSGEKNSGALPRWNAIKANCADGLGLKINQRSNLSWLKTKTSKRPLHQPTSPNFCLVKPKYAHRQNKKRRKHNQNAGRIGAGRAKYSASDL